MNPNHLLKKIYFIAALTCLFTGFAFSKTLNVVASSPDLADFAKKIGGDKVSVKSLSRGDEDPHAIEPRPSMVVSVRRADLVVVVGMDLDLWMNALVEVSKNTFVMKGGKGYLDASLGIDRKEVPSGKIDLSMGDIHALGNPHYLADPENARVVLRGILQKMSELDPDNAPYFKNNADAYLARLDTSIQKWAEIMKPFAGTKIVTWHPSWVYFVERYGLNLIGTIEPKPGIPPPPAHLKALVEKMKREGVKGVLVEPYYDLAAAKKVATSAGAQVLVFPQSAGGIQGSDDYLSLVDQNIRNFTAIFKN
ncbi:MAG: zinc ABC transporter substrate-binding protein [Spirochaetia bacterium]|nr:zinc ABC transporter substrate-binding protein [Spirochaetia bacterium]